MIDQKLVEDSYPFQAHLGFKMVEWKPDYCRFELPIAPFLMNRYGIPHGGVLASMLDTVMGFSGCYTGDRDNPKMAMTLSMNVNFVAQLQGAIMIGEGHRIGGGRKTFFTESTVKDDSGRLLATGTGVFRYRT